MTHYRHIVESYAQEIGCAAYLRPEPEVFALAEDGPTGRSGYSPEEIEVWCWQDDDPRCYLIAMHELGHQACRHGENRATKTQGEREGEAWEWALARIESRLPVEAWEYALMAIETYVEILPCNPPVFDAAHEALRERTKRA